MATEVKGKIMHDANGTLLSVGDIVNIPCVITQIDTQPDYCNVTVETIHGRKPDGNKERFGGFNAATTVLVLIPTKAVDHDAELKKNPNYVRPGEKYPRDGRHDPIDGTDLVQG